MFLALLTAIDHNRLTCLTYEDMAWLYKCKPGWAQQDRCPYLTWGLKCINSLWTSGAIWWHRFGSTLAQVMACCLMAPSHYLNQCWLIISEALWHSPQGNFTGNAQDIYPWYEFENYQLKFTSTSLRGQGLNTFMLNCLYKIFLNMIYSSLQYQCIWSLSWKLQLTFHFIFWWNFHGLCTLCTILLSYLIEKKNIYIWMKLISKLKRNLLFQMKRRRTQWSQRKRQRKQRRRQNPRKLKLKRQNLKMRVKGTLHGEG